MHPAPNVKVIVEVFVTAPGPLCRCARSEATRVLLLQCVLTGMALQEAYSSLSGSDYLRYELVKSAVLKAYELVPEAYRQRFRNWKRGDKSHLEFARDISTHFDRWCAATDVHLISNLYLSRCVPLRSLISFSRETCSTLILMGL